VGGGGKKSCVTVKRSTKLKEFLRLRAGDRGLDNNEDGFRGDSQKKKKKTKRNHTRVGEKKTEKGKTGVAVGGPKSPFKGESPF